MKVTWKKSIDSKDVDRYEIEKKDIHDFWEIT